MSSAGTPRGLLFGTAAESYERYRLGYPDEVVDRTLSHAGRPVTSAVEVGAGTGKATRAFASRGVRVAALEPDPEMYAVLQRETVAMPVQTVLTTFEAYDGPPADLVYAAASWHWTDRSTRWTHAAELLDPGGVLAIFGSQLRLADPAVEEAVSGVLADRVDDPASGPGTPASGPGWGLADIEASGLFEDVRSDELVRHVIVSQREYVGHLSTISAFLRLAAEDRQEVVRLVLGLVPAEVTLDASVVLQLARRR